MGALKYIASKLYSNDKEVALTEDNGGIETGSNGNGTYTKFPDGTAVVNMTVAYANISTADGALFKSPTVLSILPITLVNVYGGGIRVDVSGIWGSFASDGVGANSNIHRGLTSPNARTGFLTIWGRWK